MPDAYINHTYTLAEYQALEDAGRITRPLTDEAIGSTTQGKRNTDAQLSAIHGTNPDTPRDRQPLNRRPVRSTKADVIAIHETTRTNITPQIKPQKIEAECGTRSGYQKHRRLHQRQCAACLAANTEWHRWRRNNGGDDAA
jgi:hypothetical protein